jgi:hypothetical protein
MHFTIIFGGFMTLIFTFTGKDPGPLVLLLSLVLLLCLSLKAYVDLRMHIVIHNPE